MVQKIKYHVVGSDKPIVCVVEAIADLPIVARDGAGIIPLSKVASVELDVLLASKEDVDALNLKLSHYREILPRE